MMVHSNRAITISENSLPTSDVGVWDPSGPTQVELTPALLASPGYSLPPLVNCAGSPAEALSSQPEEEEPDYIVQGSDNSLQIAVLVPCNSRQAQVEEPGCSHLPQGYLADNSDKHKSS